MHLRISRQRWGIFRTFNVLGGGDAGARLLERRYDPKLKASWNAAPTDGADRSAAGPVGNRHFGPQAIRKHAAGAIGRQMKADRGVLDRLSGLIGDLDRDRTGIARAGGVNSTLALHHSNLENGGLTRRQARKYHQQGYRKPGITH